MKSLIYAFCFFISVLNVCAQNVGVGTRTPSGKLQINHRSANSPTLILYDSSDILGPILQFRNSGGIKTWQIRTLLDHTPVNNDYMDFMHNGNILATLMNSGNFGIGNAAPTQKLDVGGTIKLSGELNRSSTGTSNMVPIAYGNISSTGGINSGSGNFSVSRLNTGVYAITITGESYHFQSYTSIVTPVSSTAIIVSSSSIGGSLQVFTYNASGGAVDNQFCFVAYQQ